MLLYEAMCLDTLITFQVAFFTRWASVGAHTLAIRTHVRVRADRSIVAEGTIRLVGPACIVQRTVAFLARF